MSRYILRRLLQMIPTVILITVAVFWMLKLAPGDPLDLLLAGNPDISPEHVEHIKRLYGYDRPIYEQYGRWVCRLRRAIWAIPASITAPSPRSFPTGCGIHSSYRFEPGSEPARRHSDWRLHRVAPVLEQDNLFSFLAFFGIAMPVFWFGLILILLLIRAAKMAAAGGHYSLEQDAGVFTVLRYSIMPVIVLSLFSMASWMRYMRSGMLEVINEDYVRTAHAKGLTEGRVIVRHALKNALIPMVTLIALSIPGLISGAVLTETIFSWPGMGRLIYDSLINNDFNIAMAVFLILPSWWLSSTSQPTYFMPLSTPGWPIHERVRLESCATACSGHAAGFLTTLESGI